MVELTHLKALSWRFVNPPSSHHPHVNIIRCTFFSFFIFKNISLGQRRQHDNYFFSLLSNNRSQYSNIFGFLFLISPSQSGISFKRKMWPSLRCRAFVSFCYTSSLLCLSSNLSYLRIKCIDWTLYFQINQLNYLAIRVPNNIRTTYAMNLFGLVSSLVLWDMTFFLSLIEIFKIVVRQTYF